jgi:hypothetical protein
VVREPGEGKICSLLDHVVPIGSLCSEQVAMSANQGWPSEETAASLHTRLLELDPVAPAEFAEAYFEPVASALMRRNRDIDPHLCYEAAGEAVLSLIKNPANFRPERSSLDKFLRMAAQSDLRNLLEKEQRHRSRRAKLEVVELAPVARNILQADLIDPAAIVEQQAEIELKKTRENLAAETVAFSSHEAEVLSLMQQGERRTDAFARVLGISELSAAHQRREVKRVKDRIKRRLERAGMRDV